MPFCSSWENASLKSIADEVAAPRRQRRRLAAASEAGILTPKKITHSENDG
jgi:hypothetical protein